MDEQTKDVLDELEKAYQDTMGQTSGNTVSANTIKTNLSDEKEKIGSLIETLNKNLNDKKVFVEAKLAELKTIKGEIEVGLEELKALEAKRSLFEDELKKIEKIEQEEKVIEEEVLKMTI